jgi:hypothetical protein
MGTLINPLSRILGFKRQIFWGNNFAFNYCRVVYRQKIFQIKIFKRLFKYLFRYITNFFNFPRIYYSLSFNFVGRANSILDIKIFVHNIINYNVASLLVGYNSTSLLHVKPIINKYQGMTFFRTRIQRILDFTEVRYCRIFLKWRRIILNLFLQKLKKKQQIAKKNSLKSQAPHLLSIKIRKLKLLMKYSHYYKLKKFKKNYLKNISLKILRNYLFYKFRYLRVNIRLQKSMTTKFMMELFVIYFNMFILRIGNKFNIQCVKLNFKKKKLQAASLVRSINRFCYLALRKGYRINYVIKIIRLTVRFIKKVRGFKMIVSGRFYRRGRAMFKVSQWGEVGSQTGKNYLVYRNSERMKEYGMCSVKLLFFFRRNLKIFPKVPLRSKWFNYLKYLRSNYKIRQQFGYIRY